MSWTKVETSVEEQTGLPVVIDETQAEVSQELIEAAAKPRRGRLAKQLSSHDPVNHPAHYTAGGIETIDFIEAKELNYHLGNVIKYVSRAGKKGVALQDLEKAAWYLNREISRLKNQK